MSAQDLKKHREEAWKYYSKVKSVQEYKELEEWPNHIYAKTAEKEQTIILVNTVQFTMK